MQNPHDFPKLREKISTGRRVIERLLSATMAERVNTYMPIHYKNYNNFMTNPNINDGPNSFAI